MRLPFISHTSACHMYVTIMCTRLKHVFCFICTDKCTGRWRWLWKYFEGWTTSAKSVFSRQYTFMCYRASQSRVLTRSPFTTRIKHSNFCIFKYRLLFNFIYYIIYKIKPLQNFTLRYIFNNEIFQIYGMFLNDETLLM